MKLMSLGCGGAFRLQKLAMTIFTVGHAICSVEAMAPPITEEFLEATLPSTFLYESTTEGRIELAADTSQLETDVVPPGIFIIQGYSGSNRMRGNYYRCDETVSLNRQAMVLGRSVSTEVTFAVYESDTSGGLYSLLSTSTVIAGIGTNLVESGEMNITLIAGKYYIIGASWNQTVYYRSGGAHPAATGFGQTLNGYTSNTYPPAPTAPGAANSLLYPQQLTFSTNMVVRMDDSVDSSLTSTNKMHLLLDLAGYTDVSLRFRHREAGDEPHAGDGVFLSDDGGTTFTRIYDLDVASTAWQDVTLDIDALAAANALALNGSVVLSFQQVDNYGWPTDGREFDDIRIYSKVDLAAESLALSGGSTVTNTWKGFSTPKTVAVAGSVIGTGTLNDSNYPAVEFGYLLEDSASTSVYYDSDVQAWFFAGMASTTGNLSKTISMPGTLKLTDNLYTLSLEADAGDVVDEALEGNNLQALNLAVNHYSGRLWFDSVEADITVKKWTAASKTDHRITGTGTINGHAFSFTNYRVLKNLTTLDYSVHPANATVIAVNTPGRKSVAGVSFWLPDGITMGFSGVDGDVEVLLPAGLGIKGDTDYVMDSRYVFSMAALAQGLYPSSAVTDAGPLYISEETKPLFFLVDDISWDPSLGRFTFTKNDAVFVRETNLATLESYVTDLADPTMIIKRSNAQYYRYVDSMLENITVTTAGDTSARMNTAVGLAAGHVMPHFPYGPDQVWKQPSDVVIREDLINASSQLVEMEDVAVQYARACAGNSCSGGAGPQSVVGYAIADSAFSLDGGIRQPVGLGINLRWGVRHDGAYAQEAVDFIDGIYYMPGHFLRGDQSDLASRYGPAVILLSGMLDSNSAVLERPGHYAGDEDYRNGFGDYAGINMRWHPSAVHKGKSILGGRPDAAFWDLTTRCKYYIRPSGVSGIHEAIPGSFPQNLEIYGYDHGFSQYGLSYLSNEPEESRVSGQVSLSYPANFDIEYEEMRFDCLGEILDADISGAPGKTMDYWNAVIDPGTLFYAPTEAATCANNERVLCLGVSTSCANIEQQLSGILGFLNTGHIAAPEDGVVGVDSRLSVGNKVELDGPADEIYYFNPVVNPYYNDYIFAEYGLGSFGWINFAGSLDVAFFNDLQVLFHTSASTNNAYAPIYMTGGFVDSNAETFISDPENFDPGNTGKPAGVDVADFRNPDSDTYRVRAQQDFLDVVDFNYPLGWSSASKSFKSPEAIVDDLLVLSVEHQTDYLSAENAEISFGVQYDGLPQINLANMAFNEIDEQTGMAQAFVEGVGEELSATIENGLDSFDDLLSDLPEDLFDPLLDVTVDPVIDQLYIELLSAYNGTAAGTDYYSALISNYVGVGSAGVDDVLDAFDDLTDFSSATTNLMLDFNRKLDDILYTIDAFSDVITINPITGAYLQEPINGLLNLEGTHFEVLGDLASTILGYMAADLAHQLGGDLIPKTYEFLDEVKSGLDSSREYLLQVRQVVEQAQAGLEDGFGFSDEIRDAMDTTEIENAMLEAAGEINAWFDEITANGDLFDEYTPEEIKQMIRRKIYDEFYASASCANVQQLLRSRLYDVDASMREAIDSVFQQLNKAMRDLVSEYVAGIDDEINGMLGDLSDIIGSGQINGYAHINNDSLTELRLDGAFQWKVPDEMEFNAYMIFRQLDSDGSASCGMAGDSAAEVVLGSEDLDLSWTGEELRASIETKFAFKTSPDFQVIGLSGSFEMTEGTIGFEAFDITELYAAVAFGALENYLSASIHCTFTEFDVEGGVFFGRTCSLDPFAWDPDVQAILGDPPFTGVYVYGEGWMPIVSYGCLFQIKAGVGAGVFAFVDGPIGGKIFLGAEGEALCVVSVRGEVTLIGMKNGDLMRMTGKGRISGKAGACPFCVKFSKSAEITYENGSWDADY